MDALTPEYRRLLELIPEGLIDMADIARTRARVHQRIAASPARPASPGVAIRDDVLPGDGTRPGPGIRLYTPASRPAPSGALLFIHGGGFVMGELSQGDLHCMDIAARAGCVVAAVDYRLAPEHPYPAALEDCYAGLTFLARQNGGPDVDPGRVAVAGVSAGGGLAAGLALLSRDRGGPRIALQMLEAPMLDHRGVTPSSQEIQHPKVWDGRANQLAWRAYLGGTDTPVSPYASPALAVDLGGLPPAYIAVSAKEMFRDEALEYAQRLMAAAVPVEMHVYPDGFHGSTWGFPETEQSRRWRTDSIGALAAAVGH